MRKEAGFIRYEKKEVAEMKKQRVLVVEDEAIVRESLEDWLKEVGYQVAGAEDGEQALKIFGEQDFGVLVLDLKLPGKDGIEVLKMAKAQKPWVKGIIITAYPSTETAVKAMQAGAVEYLPKPFAPDVLERLIEQALGGVKEIGSETDKETEIARKIARREKEISAHIAEGKSRFQAGEYAKALSEFEWVLVTAPGNLEARIWIQKAKKAIAEPGTVVAGGVEEGVKPKECVWMKMGVVSYRLCTRDYDCLTCDFDQSTQKQAAQEVPGVNEAIERLKALAGNQRFCRYAVRGEISHRLCTHLFQCANCAFDQTMQDALEQKMTRLAARREALRKRAKAEK